MEEEKILYILKFCKHLSIVKLCAEIFQPQIEHYNAHSKNTKKQTKTHRQA